MSDYFDFTAPLGRQTLARAGTLNAIFRQIETALNLLPSPTAIQTDTVTFGTDTGAANAYLISIASAPEAYTAGFSVKMLAANTNTGASTINVNSLGSKQIRNFFGGTLVAGDIQAGAVVPLVYDGTVFRFTASTPVALTEEQLADAIAGVVAPVTSVNSATGAVVLTAADVSAVPTTRTVTSGAGLTGGGALSANREIALTGQALALHEFAASGILARTGSATYAARALTAGTGVAVTNGDGIAGNPTIAADIATDANIRAGTASKLVAAQEIYTSNSSVATSGSGTYTPDLNAGRVFQRTLTGNSTLANPTNQVAGQSGVIFIVQDATGSRTLSFGGNWKFAGGTPAISSAANAVDALSYYVVSSGVIRATHSRNFS